MGRDNLPFLFGRALYTKEGWIVLSDNVKYTVANFDELNVLDNHDTDVIFIESFDAHYLLPFGSSDRVCLVKHKTITIEQQKSITKEQEQWN